MNSKTYQAPSMSEALAEVKRDLGRDAVILHTRSYRKGGFLRLVRRRPMWEVTAAPNLNVIPRASSGDYVGVDSNAFVPEQSGQATATMAPTSKAGELERISEMLEMLVSERPDTGSSKLPPVLGRLREHLCDQDVAETLAGELISELQMSLTGKELARPEIVRARLTDLVAARIQTAPPTNGKTVSGRTIALIGPTGVGKTTTVAKLAANMKLRESKRVGLITIDTYRIAAVDQLKTYAEIIDIPMRTVLNAQEMAQAIYAMRGMDAILIDTVGRSQNDRLRLNELRGFLAAADADEIHLVVSATANRRCAASVVKRFKPLGANSVIVTKLDEAEAFGMVLNVSADAGIPLSYVSTGQEVPDDIAPADARELAARIIKGSDYDA